MSMKHAEQDQPNHLVDQHHKPDHKEGDEDEVIEAVGYGDGQLDYGHYHHLYG